MAGPLEEGVTEESAGGNGPAARDWSEERERSLRLWITLARCYSTYSRAVAGKMVEYGLTTPQFGVLEALYHIGPLPLGTLADKLLVTGGNVTYVMDRLEDQGLVRRARSPEDGRVIEAHLTRKGREVIAEVFPGHAAFIEQLAGHLDAQEQEELRMLLRKLGRAIARNDLGRQEA